MNRRIFILLTVTALLPGVLLARKSETVSNRNALERSVKSTSGVTQAPTQKKITGTVVDAAGVAVIGANVVEAGTANGTITNVDGHFTLNVSETADIVVSCIGFNSQTVPVTGKQNFQVVLSEDSQLLNEVVVVGYGVQKKKLITGATVQVKGEELQKRNTVNPVNALQGQSPGVSITKNSGQPGSDFKVSIRGLGTVGDATPLYIVDGVTVGSIDHLNPADIEMIDVLKDAASAAIYGARAANGVIIVTTKKGRSGKASIEYEGYLGWQNISRKAKALNAQQYAMIMSEAAENSGMAPYNYAGIVPNWSRIANGEWSGTDWMKEMTNQNAPMQSHSLSFRGGTEQSVYSVGLSYTQQEGSFGKPHAPQYSRYGALVNTEHTLIKGSSFDVVKLGENINYTYTERNVIGTGNLYNNDIRSAFSTNPFMPVYDEKGDYHYALTDWDDKQANPMGMLYYDRSNNLNQTHRLLGNIYMEVQPVKSLKFKSSFGINLSSASYRSFVPTYNLSPNKFNAEDRTIQQMNTGFKWMFENTFTYDLTLSTLHAFNFLIGTSAEKSGLGVSLRGENINSTFSDFEHAYLANNPLIYEGKTQLIGGPESPGQLLSYFGRVNYNFNETYMATIVVRADGSSKFAAGNRWGYFPSVSAGWVLSNEKFMKPASTWLDFLKLRFSWGQNGNQNIANFQYLSNISFDSKYFFGDNKSNAYPGAYPSSMANPEVKWETSEQTNVGIDARFLNHRLQFVFDWYNKTTKDWLLIAPVLGSYGTGAPYINGGDVSNKGVEFGVNWRDEAGPFRYGISANLAYNKNEVTRIANSEGIIHGPSNVISHNTSELYRAQVGYPIGYFWGYKTNGLFQNKEEVLSYKNPEGVLIMPDAQPGDLRFVDQNKDGVINDNDKVMIGDPNPDFTFGFTANLEYKGFDLSITANGVAGNQIVRAYRSANLPLENYTTDILGRWHGEGTSHTIPRVTGAASINELYISDRYIESGDYLRIANVTAGYDFKKLLKKLPLQQARVYVTGQNLATITNYKGLDPEVGYGYNSTWASGIDLGFYPSPKIFMVGLSIKY